MSNTMDYPGLNLTHERGVLIADIQLWYKSIPLSHVSQQLYVPQGESQSMLASSYKPPWLPLYVESMGFLRPQHYCRKLYVWLPPADWLSFVICIPTSRTVNITGPHSHTHFAVASTWGDICQWCSRFVNGIGRKSWCYYLFNHSAILSFITVINDCWKQSHS